MKQKDIYLVNLNPTRGSEQAGVRPAVIVSGDIMNEHSKMKIVCPISSKLKFFSTCVQIKGSSRSGLRQDSEIITFQIRSISSDRFIKKIGVISDKELKEVFKNFVDIFSY